MQIPIRNIYYLLSYAWQYYRPTDLNKVNLEDFENETEFFASLFDLILSKYVKKGLYRSYKDKKEPLTAIKGSVDFTDTLKNLSFKTKKFYCNYDEYSTDNSRNRVIYSTIRLLLQSRINSEVKQSLKTKLIYFNGVSIVKTDNTILNSLRPVRGDNSLNYLIQLSRYIQSNTSFDEKEGSYVIGDFQKNETSMAAIFENFVLNFYKKHLPENRVGSEVIRWDSITEDLTYPIMKTDITIRGTSKILVIDTKYYSKMFQYHYLNQDKPKFRSNNIYQLYTYLNNLKEENKVIEGMLLYPNTTSSFRSERVVSGKKIKINNINLSNDWRSIEEEMLELVN